MSLDALSRDMTDEKVVEELKSIFDKLTRDVDPHKVRELTPHVELESHKKILLEKAQTELGELILELIIFSDGIPTGAHIHPRYMVDRIVDGELEETLFLPDGEVYKISKTIKRSAGEERAICCPKSFPHDVKAVNGNCLSLSMTLGEEKVEKIKID